MEILAAWERDARQRVDNLAGDSDQLEQVRRFREELERNMELVEAPAGGLRPGRN